MAALAMGFLLDLLFGDPQWLPHPICMIGNFIAKTEAAVRRLFPKTEKGELAAGASLVAVVLIVSTAVPFALLWAAEQVHLFLRIGLEAVMCYQILSVKSLKTESMKVYQQLAEGSLAGARCMVARIVGRDVDELNEEEVTKAAVETVAENTADGTVAPLLFLLLGGAPFGFFYKAVNTMDSMVGYKNDRYLYFGRTAAKLDDAANFVPARLAALLMILAAFLLRLSGRNAWRIFWRDRFNHASPNSAQTESVCAGALEIQLAGDAYYFGKLYPKKTIGDAVKPIDFSHIQEANRLLYGTAWLMFICCILGLGVLQWIS